VAPAEDVGAETSDHLRASWGGQLRNVPAPTQGLGQGHARDQAAREDIDSRAPVLQQAGLRGDQLQVDRDAISRLNR
jgi:hypothetical protein